MFVMLILKSMHRFWNLKAKGETELFTLLAKLVGSATVDGSKAAVYVPSSVDRASQP